LATLATTRAYPFLQGGGEMGKLTRSYDWSKTPLGKPEYWPQSLRTTVAMILSSRFPMFLWWGEDLIQFYNDAYRPSLGNDGKHPQALGQKGFECWPEIWEVIYPLIYQVQSTGEATWSEDQLIPIFRNNKIEDVYWTLSFSPIFGDFDSIEGVLVVCQETTQTVQNVLKLRQSETRFEALIAAAPIAIGLFVGRDLIIDMHNQTFAQIVGKGDNIIGKPLAEVMPELITENQPFLKILDNVYTSGKIFETFGTRVDIVQNGIMKQGYYDFSYTPLFDADENVYAILDIAVDVTEQVLAKIRLIQSEENLRNTILRAPVAMCILRGTEHVVDIANERMIEIWGKTFAEVTNKPIFEGVPEAKNQGFEKLLHDVYTTGKTFTAQGVPISLSRGNKTEIVFVNFVYQAYKEADDTISGIIAVVTDVTDQVLARQKIEEIVAQRTTELAEANKALQQSNQELEQFAYIASHDMQEPLRKVVTYTNMLENTLGLIEERSKNYIEKITASTTRMSQLIKDVLNFSRLSKAGETFVPIDLNMVMESITTDFELLIEQKKATINITHLPNIEAVPLQMHQLFSNLISNSLKFTRWEIPPVVNITSKLLSNQEKSEYGLQWQERNYFIITVEDNGIGFKQEHAQHIFNIFQRLHIKTEYSGTGIGLALCKKIVQNHEGEILAESNRENGAIFKIILPEKQKSIQ